MLNGHKTLVSIMGVMISLCAQEAQQRATVTVRKDMLDYLLMDLAFR